jgi:hypothetical protein
MRGRKEAAMNQRLTDLRRAQLDQLLAEDTHMAGGGDPRKRGLFPKMPMQAIVNSPGFDPDVPSDLSRAYARRMAEKDAYQRSMADQKLTPSQRAVAGAEATGMIGSALFEGVQQLPKLLDGEEAYTKAVGEGMYQPRFQPEKAAEYAGNVGDFLEKLETEYKMPALTPELLPFIGAAEAAKQQSKRAVKQGALTAASRMDAGPAAGSLAAQRGVVKMPGGNWLGGSVESQLKDFKSRGSTEADREWLINHAKQNPEVAQIGLDSIPKNEAINKWVESNLTNYVKKQMATPDDPVRKLAEQGIVHMPNQNTAAWNYEVSRKRAGYPIEGFGISPEAKSWEQLADSLVYTDTAKSLIDPDQITDLVPHLRNDQAYLNLQKNPWLSKVNPETNIYSLGGSGLGFDHIVDVLKQDLAEGRIRPEQMNKVSMEQAVRRTYEYDQEMAKKMSETQAKVTEGMPVHKEYPEGYKWIELSKPNLPDVLPEGWSEPVAKGNTFVSTSADGKRVLGNDLPDIIKNIYRRHPETTGNPRDLLEKALKYEGDTMGHCVGGYCPDVESGQSRIYSLRDAKGEPHVTVEVKPHEGWFTKADKTPDPTGKNKSFHELIDNERSELAQQKGGFGNIGESYEDTANRLANQYQLEAKPMIKQIKGKGNRAPKEDYLPFVQDFVKSGNWSDVGDLRNTGLRATSDAFNETEQAFLKSKGVELKPYIDPEETARYQELFKQTPPAEGMASGGSVGLRNALNNLLRTDKPEVHMSIGGFLAKPATKAAPKAAKAAGKAATKLDLAEKVPKGVEPIIVRSPEERAVIEKFGQKQEQEAVRQKKVEKAAKESAGKSPEESVKPPKSTGKRVAVPPDIYRKMAETQGDEAVLRAARAGKHLKPTGEGYIGAPRTVTSPQGLGAMRRDMDTDFADSVEAVRLADPDRLGTWYDRAKQGIAESVEPYQLPRTLEQHGVYSAGVSPESELTFALKHLNSRVAGKPEMAYRGAGMRNLDTAVAQQRPAKMGFKIGEYAEKNDPRVPNAGLFGVNDFRRAQGMGYTDPQGNPWKAGVSDTMHPFMDAETALQVDRANTAGTGGRIDWAGPHIQEVPWVYGKGQDLYSRGKGGRYSGDELEGIKQSLVDANNTARDYMYKHAASATHEQIPGASLGHVRQALDMTPEQKLAYGREGRFDIPSPEAALNEYPEVGAGNRDAIYSALGYRQLPSREAEGLYINSLGGVETNPMTIARPLMDFPTGGGGGRMADESSKMMDTAEQFRALMDAQEAGAYNLPNTMDSVKGKNAMVLDTRSMNPNRLADPSAGVLPTAEQLSQINKSLGEASGKAEKNAEKLREKMPYGPPTKSFARKLQGLDEAAGGYGVTATNRGALIFPYNSESGAGGLNEIMRNAGSGLEEAFPGAQRQKAIASTGYVPGVGKRSPEGPLSTAPYSGEATSDMLQAFVEMHPTVAQNLSESEAVRAAIRAKALRDSKLGGARGDIQETRRFFSEADWPKAVAMMRKGISPAAALAALGYNINAMAADER